MVSVRGLTTVSVVTCVIYLGHREIITNSLGDGHDPRSKVKYAPKPESIRYGRAPARSSGHTSKSLKLHETHGCFSGPEPLSLGPDTLSYSTPPGAMGRGE